MSMMVPGEVLGQHQGTYRMTTRASKRVAASTTSLHTVGEMQATQALNPQTTHIPIFARIWQVLISDLVQLESDRGRVDLSFTDDEEGNAAGPSVEKNNGSVEMMEDLMQDSETPFSYLCGMDTKNK
ncbi:hypothetical protein HMI56_001464 [Coelomomyces lativittatus]|nr:hypothetical protein HMI56_001464 [Coelomomyces lativittatus]